MARRAILKASRVILSHPTAMALLSHPTAMRRINQSVMAPTRRRETAFVIIVASQVTLRVTVRNQKRRKSSKRGTNRADHQSSARNNLQQTDGDARPESENDNDEDAAVFYVANRRNVRDSHTVARFYFAASELHSNVHLNC